MAIIAGRKIDRRAWLRGGGSRGQGSRIKPGRSFLALTALATVAVSGLSARPVAAQTEGTFQGVVSGFTVLSDLVGAFGLIQPAQPTQAVDFANTGYAYIKNPNIAVVLGIAGTYSVNYGQNLNITYNAPGMLSFGNQRGSLLFANDDFKGMNGLNTFESLVGGRPLGYGMWPLPGHYQVGGAFVSYDYSAYTRVQVDGNTATPTLVPILGSDLPLLGPVIDRGPEGWRLRTVYNIANNTVQIEQQISLYNQQAKIRWIIRNIDNTAGHSVGLRFVVNNRAAFTGTGAGGAIPLAGFHYVDPIVGVTKESSLLTGANIPDQLNIYGKRYEQDSPTDPPFAVRHTFRGFGATLPTQVYVTNPFELRPENAASYLPGDTPSQVRQRMDDGIAVASYYGPFNLPIGGSAEVVTYYGNGVPSERMDNDYTVSAEGTEALAYNSGAAIDPEIVGEKKTGADVQTVGRKFLTPNPFRIYGEVYNRAPSTPQTSFSLDGVRASLVLPQGLQLATDPVTGNSDVPEKVLGNNGTIPSDRNSNASWLVEPRGDVFGTLTYQVSFQTRDFGSKQISRTITIPATPFRSVSASTFQMVGFPFEFDPVLSNNGDPATVINTLTTPEDEPVAFYRWDPTIQDYGPPVSQLVTGYGYFYRPNFDRTFYARGVKPVPAQAPLGNVDLDDVRKVQITLQQGWNMISNPYLYDVPIKYLQFRPPGDNTNILPQTFAQAVNSGLIRGGIFFYDVNARAYDFFDNAEEALRPWEGYWIFANSPVILIYPLTSQRQSAIIPDPIAGEPPTRKKTGAIASGRAFGSNPTPENWALHLVARQGGSPADGATIIGVDSTGMAESKRVVPKPPAPVRDYVYVGVVKPDVKSRFVKDIQTGRGTKTWNVEVVSDHDGPVTLTWPNIGKLPRRVNISAKEETTGRTISLRGASSLTLNVKKGQPTRLVITAKPQASQPLTISGLRTVQSGGSRSEGRGFVFNLNREATVSIQVETITGKVVANVANGRSASAGENRFTWAGRAQSGASLPPGAYMVKVTARAGDDEAPVTMKVPFTTLQ
jgi:hypothetical protein